MRDIEKKDNELLLKAARHGAKKWKEKVGKRGKSRPGEPPGKFKGKLIKGIKGKLAKTKKHTAYTGTVAPAYHAFLLEMGTRFMDARPSLVPTLMQESQEIIKILSEERV